MNAHIIISMVVVLAAAVVICCSVPSKALSAFAAGSTSRHTTAFSNPQPRRRSSSQPVQLFSLSMDVEQPFQNIPLPTRHDIKFQIPRQDELSRPFQRTRTSLPTNSDVDETLAEHGLPWKASIDPTYKANSETGLFYMPFFEWQIQFMKENLTNLRVLPTESKTGQDLSYMEGATATTAGTTSGQKQQPVRMVTLCFASNEYRKIRMTVYDAGNKTQVFTSLFYPAAEYDLPVLGIDLLQFNLEKHLCVVDFQPLHSSEQEHAQCYEHKPKPIRDAYPSLQGKMTKRFYDEDRYFSNQMLYSRFEELQEQEQKHGSANEEHPVYRDLFPAFQQYVQNHLDLVRSTPAQAESIARVLQGQANYDSYSADRDPAHAMFTKVFGPELADAFVYDVLFSFSKGNQRKLRKHENHGST